jgi:hypothetical protein
VTTARHPVVLPVNGAGRFAGMLRHGSVGGYPIHAAACSLCIDAVYDLPTFEDAALWIRRHLTDEHRVRVVKVDARRLVHRQRAAVGEEITEVVARLAAVGTMPMPPHWSRGRRDGRRT